MAENSEHRRTQQQAGPNGAAVRVRRHSEFFELRFDRGFGLSDVEAVRKISGRKWVPERRVWILPQTAAMLDMLTATFGSRLVLDGVRQAGVRPVADAQPAADMSSATQTHGAGAQRTTDASPTQDHVLRTTSDVRAGADSRDALAEVQREPDAVPERMRSVIRTREYSRKTEKAYVGWAQRFFEYGCGTVSPGALAAPHALAFLEHLAARERLSARSRNQAASALRFLFREVMQSADLLEIPRAKGPRRMPLVLTIARCCVSCGELTGKYFLVAVLLYSAGLRIEECLRLRVKDIDFELRQIHVRDGKGRKDRYVPLARRAVELLRRQISRVRELHARDRGAGHGWAALPGAMHRKEPNAGYELGWQWIFPASTISKEPVTGRTGRWPLHVTAVQREIKRAVRRSGIPKRATCHTLRHSFATEALRGGCDIRTLQHVMGHKDIRTTMIYLHVVEQTGFFIRSPLDRPDDPEDDADDPVAKPWSGIDFHWDLAARQWSADRRAHPRPTHRKSSPDTGGA